MRLVLAFIAGAAVAAMGAVMLGEYELVGITPYVAAVLFAVVIAELLRSVAGQPSVVLVGGAAMLTVIGLLWAAWIQAGRDWSYVPGATWASLAVGAVAAALWVRSSARRGASTTSDPPPPPAG